MEKDISVLLADNAIFVIVVQDAQDEHSKVINTGFRRVRVPYQPHILKETIILHQRSVRLVHVVEEIVANAVGGGSSGVSKNAVMLASTT
jgi:hypothetical protein